MFGLLLLVEAVSERMPELEPERKKTPQKINVIVQAEHTTAWTSLYPTESVWEKKKQAAFLVREL